jgi:hypothetical protein
MDTQIDSTSEGTRTGEPDENVRFWLSEIDAARKRDKEFREHGQRILDIYEAKKSTPFNILYSNTETMSPALYSATPRPIVQRRFKDADPLGKVAAQAGQRVLEFLLDTNIDGYETFDQGMGTANLDGLLPGRAFTCVKYDVKMGELPPAAEPPTGQSALPADTPAASSPYMQSELVCLDSKSWNRVLMGYAKKWSKVPWIAYEEAIDKEEAVSKFGAEIAEKLVYTDEDNQDKERDQKEHDEKNKGERKTVCIYQIWDKDGGRKVRYISPQYKDGYLKVEDDPLELTGFFNCPKPLQFVEKTNSLVPTALYLLYEEQASELNDMTSRIRHIVKALKARGVYSADMGADLSKLMEAEDNELIPAENGASLATEKGFQNAIWFLPLDQLIVVLQQLLLAREQCKQVIYEITGISDILRGSTKASETFGAQELKSQWGTLRFKNKQKEVQRYAKDLLRMMLEIAASKFSEETWAKMTGLPFMTTQDRQKLDMIAQAMQQAKAQGQQIPQEQEQQIQQQLQTPVWGQVLAMLKDDIQRAYRIDIETNSTVEPEAVEDQRQITELLTAMGQYLNGVTPLIVSGSMPFEMAKSMLLVIVRRFRFGTEIEEFLQNMQPPKLPDEGKKEIEQQKMAMEEKKQQAEMAQSQQEGQLKLQEIQLKIEADKIKLQLEQAKLQMEMQKMQLEVQLEREKMGMQQQQMGMDMEMKKEQHMLSRAEMHDKHLMNRETNKMKMDQMKQQAKQPARAGR